MDANLSEQKGVVRVAGKAGEMKRHEGGSYRAGNDRYATASKPWTLPRSKGSPARRPAGKRSQSATAGTVMEGGA